MKSIRDVAKRAHVSISTVSKSFGGATDISEETRTLVLKCAAEIGYQGRVRKTKVKGKLCILAGINYENANHFGYEVILGFRTAALQEGYDVDVFPIRPSGASYSEIVSSQNYNGGFLLGLNLQDGYLAELERTDVPSVLLDNYIDNPNIAFVGTDDGLGFLLAVEHLHQLGHRNIAFLNGSSNSSVSIRRDQAFRSAIDTMGLPLFEPNIVYGDFYNDVAPLYVPQFISNGATAIICASDIIAADVKNALAKLRLRIPQDISVVGYDDLLPAQFGDLTTVAQSRLSIGKMAFVMLREMLGGTQIDKLLLRPHLVIRGSTAPPDRE